jgi:hypothetical protein
MADSVKSVIDEILFKMDLDLTNPTAIERSDVLREINTCLRDLAEKTRLFMKSDTTSLVLVSGTASYDLPVDHYETFILKDTNNETIYPTTLDVLETIDSDWEDIDYEIRYFIEGYAGPKKITLFGKPGADDAGNILKLRYYYYPDAVTDSESSYLPDPIGLSHKLVVDFCLGQLRLAETEVKDVQKSQIYTAAYLAERNKWDKKSVAPRRMLIYGSTGKRTKSHGDLRMPSNYPSLKTR